MDISKKETLSTIQESELKKIHQKKSLFIEQYVSTQGDAHSVNFMYETLDGSFFFEGNMQYLPVRSFDEYTLKNLNFIQSAGTMECDSRYYTSRSNFDSYLLMIVSEGEGSLKYENRDYILKKGDVLFMDCRKPHYYKTLEEPWIHTDIHIMGPKIGELYEKFTSDGNVVFSLPSLSDFMNQVNDMFYLHQHETIENNWFVSNSIEHLILTLLKHKYSRHSTAPLNDSIQYLKHYMENNFAKEFTIDELAEFSGISKYHLIREFKKSTGFTPINYLIELRITHAKSLLMGTNMSIQSVASYSGFKSMNNFISQFEKRCGMSPNKYRKSFTQ